MGENIVRYEGNETVADGHPGPIIVKRQNLPLEVTIGLLIGLVFTGLVFWLSNFLSKKILPDIGEDANDFLTEGFSAALGITGGMVSGMPLKYKWLPRTRSRMGRPGHPASIDLEFTVSNPRGARMHVHKEGVFNKPLGSLPQLGEAPPLMESRGFVLRLEPQGILSPDSSRILDEAITPFCDAGLYEATLKVDKFCLSLVRTRTYEIEEAKTFIAAAAKAAALFN